MNLVLNCISATTKLNRLFYSSTSITWGDGRDPQYVEDGAKCAEDKVTFLYFKALNIMDLYRKLDVKIVQHLKKLTSDRILNLNLVRVYLSLSSILDVL